MQVADRHQSHDPLKTSFTQESPHYLLEILLEVDNDEIHWLKQEERDYSLQGLPSDMHFHCGVSAILQELHKTIVLCQRLQLQTKEK
jgi:hypothetical protein